VIRAEQVTKRYRAITAVDALTFEVSRGETFAIIGPNGAGKTTTLKLLLGLAHPDSGTITIGPERVPPRDVRARRGLGYVPQRVEFPRDRTVAEVLGFYAELRGLPRGAVGESLARVRLEGLAGRRAGELSGGYMQRLALAQALLGDPGLLVLDEPTASLDPEATWEFRSLVEQLQREDKTILLCSHLLSEVERVADRVLIMVDGRRAALESIAELRARQVGATRLHVELVGDPAPAIGALEPRGFALEVRSDRAIVVETSNGGGLEALDALRAAGVAIHSFELQRPTLEELFLEVVRAGRANPGTESSPAGRGAGAS
jgi:ABC-type multidrug transport system ATPase subunit